MIRFLIVTLLTLTTFVRGQEIDIDNCGIAAAPSGLVFGGKVSEAYKWPWLAALYYTESESFFCGGTLLSSKLVSTAAHCIQNKGETTSRQPNEIAIKLGRFDLSKPLERGSETIYPYEIHIHPDWKQFTESFDADFALITFENPVTYKSNIFPICLWSRVKKPKMTSGTVVGWGRSEFGTSYENKPREAVLSIKENEECLLENSRIAIIASNRTFCAGNPEIKKNVCGGDSGSGLFIEYKRHWYLLGIVSASFIRDGQCDITNYAVYTNALKYKDWISEIAAKTNVALPKVAESLSNGANRTHNKEIVCSVINWSGYRPGEGEFTLNNVKPELCTTLVYHNAGLNETSNEIISIDPWQDFSDNGGNDGFRRATSLKVTHPHLRVLLSLGGWNEGSKKFSDLAASEKMRNEFAANAAEFLKRFNFDGMNFYWDHPAFRGGQPSDRGNFVKLVKAIKTAFSSKNLYLSATFRAAKYVAEKAYDLRNLAEHLDAMMLATFDFKGTWEMKVGFPAALRGDDQFSVQNSVKYFLDNGAPSEKLILGIPFYGQTFVTSGQGRIGGATVDNVGFQGPFVTQNAQLGYNEMCQMSKTVKWRTTFERRSSSSISRYSVDDKTRIVIYDSQRSVANKARFVVENGLAGVWAWSIDTDEFHGACNLDASVYADFPNKPKSKISEKDFPLLRTANEALDFAAKLNVKKSNSTTEK